MKRSTLLLTALLLLSACQNGSPETDERTDHITGQIVRSGYVAVPGGNVFYEMSNPDAAGIPLLLIHGGPGGFDKKLWRSFCDQ